ncbi:uncharacterized protein [Engystomops pustulosus]|uniref:uncharacterized protein isoform X2 n=1 Tax=Engystomops pustulosus TaxID=76066 RepID=UPI003AFABF9D
MDIMVSDPPPITPESKEKEKSKDLEKKKAQSRRCNMCFNKLLNNYKKPVCKECLDNLLKEEKYSFMEEMRSFIKGEVQTSVAASVASIIPQIVPPKRPRVMESYSEAESEEASTSCSLDMDISQSIAATKMESKCLFASENLDALLKAVRDTLKIEEAKSVQDELFGILKAKKKRVFPINNTLKELILEEWREPENRISVSKEFKNRLIFDEEEVKNWNTTPKVDVQVTKITKKTDLPSEDAIQLKDPMDRKADSLLKKAWETAMLNLKVNIATTSVSRTLFFWLSELENHIKSGTSREMLLDTIPML